MTDASFSSILDTPATDAVRPPAMPVGHYLAQIKGFPTKGTSPKKGTPYIEYTVEFLQPFEDADGNIDIDAEQLEAFGDVRGKTMRYTFYVTEGSAYRHREFLENTLGIDLSGKSHWEGAQEAMSQQLVVQVKQTPTNDGKGFFSEIASTAAVE